MRAGRGGRKVHRWKPIARMVGVTLLALAAFAPASASAGPAHYTYEVCDASLPGGNTPGVRFVANPGVALTPSNTCSTPGGGLSITETGHVSGTFSFWDIPVAAPPGGFIESITVSAQACGLGPAHKAFVFEQGWPGNCGGETQRIFHADPGILNGGLVFLGCNGNFPAGCEAGASISAHFIAAHEVDPKPPTLTALKGSLLANGLIRGHQDLSVSAADVGGGLSRITLSVNGLPAVQPEAPNCNLQQVRNVSIIGEVAVTVTPCPTKLDPSWNLDTSAFPFQDGPNTVQVCASDYASLSEPNTTCSPTQTINVDNSCTESSVTGGEVINASFEASRGEEITVPYARPANVTGQLTNSAGTGISGATVCVQMQTEGSSEGLAPVAVTKTDSSGHFAYKVPAGPNRTVLLGYRHDRFQVSRSIHYRAHSGPTLRLSRKKVRAGGWIRINGNLPGPRPGARVVVLQASAPGSKRWYTFKRATTNAGGAFQSRYRFDATTATTAYRIRAVVPRQGDYAYEGGHSKAARIKVTVRRR